MFKHQSGEVILSREVTYPTAQREEMKEISRREALRRGGIVTGGVLFGGSTTGAAQETAGRPHLRVSAPKCGTIELDYTQGKPSLTVYIYDSTGSEYAVVELTRENRTRRLGEVPNGEYTVEPKPGDEFDDGDTDNSGVVVTGSPVDVDECGCVVDDSGELAYAARVSPSYVCARAEAEVVAVSDTTCPDLPKDVRLEVKSVLKGTYVSPGTRLTLRTPAGHSLNSTVGVGDVVTYNVGEPATPDFCGLGRPLVHEVYVE
jgi:hypothetical protein